MGRHLLEQGDNIVHRGVTLPGTGSLAITFDETGTVIGDVNELSFLVLSGGTTSVNIASTGTQFTPGQNELPQIAETSNNLTTVTISGSVPFILGSETGVSNSGDGVVTDIAAKAASPTTIHSSLALIDASATTFGVTILAGATNTSGAGNFDNGASLNANVTITYTGLTIKGGSGFFHRSDLIENDAKQGVVIDGNGFNDQVILGGSGAKATLGTGSADMVVVGSSNLGTNEAAGSALGDKVTFGAGAGAELFVGIGAEAGSTGFFGSTSIGLTKVLGAAAGMQIDFVAITGSSNIFDETNTPGVASAKSLAAAEDAAIKALAEPGVAYFTFGTNEYFIATDNIEKAVSPSDAIVKLVGITHIHNATNIEGLVTLASCPG
jgi:hypothetical protein